MNNPFKATVLFSTLLFGGCSYEAGPSHDQLDEALTSAVESHQCNDEGCYWLEVQSSIDGSWIKTALVFGFFGNGETCGKIAQSLSTPEGFPKQLERKFRCSIAISKASASIKRTKESDFKALQKIRVRAELGDIEAQHKLASAYYLGTHGVSKDLKVAYRLFSMAADQGEISSQYTLGIMHLNGEGVAQDYVAAAEWFSKAANAGSAGAQLQLAHMYEQGTGVEQDYVEAYKLSTFASESTSKNIRLQALTNLRRLIHKMSPDQVLKAEKERIII